MTLPRVVTFAGVEVYAPRCTYCGSDEHTRWTDLPTSQEACRFGAFAVAWCERCGGFDKAEGTFYPSRLDAYRAREPERLDARLAELRAEARSSAA